MRLLVISQRLVLVKHPGSRASSPSTGPIDKSNENTGNRHVDSDRSGDDGDAVLGGLTDCVGEMARKAVQWATKGEYKKIDQALDAGREIVSALMGLNLTGYLRTKLDQAKGALRRIEDVAYDVAMRELRNK